MPALFLEVAVRATLIAAGTAGILRALRIRTAAARHAAWTTVVIAMLLLPIWSLAGPKVPLAVLPANAASADADSNADPNPRAQGVLEPSSQPGATPIAETGSAVSRSTRGVWLLIAVYLLGALALLVRLAIGTVHAHRLCRGVVMRAGRATSAWCATPITVGWLSPVLILPEEWQRWSAAHLDAVLTHEQEHARRHDPLIQWFALLNRAMFWFHPVAWWLERRLASLAEEACDAAVLRAGHSPQDYSGYLIEMARTLSRQGRRLNVAGMAMPGSGLPNRMRHIFEELPMTPPSRTWVICTLAFCTTSSIVFASGTLAPRASAVAHSQATAVVQLQSSVPLATPPAPVNQVRAGTNASPPKIVERLQPDLPKPTRGGLSPVNETNFSGDWLLLSTVSSGPGRGGGDGRLVSITSGAPVNCGLECTITQNAAALTISRTVETPGVTPPDIGTVVLNLDGSESTITFQRSQPPYPLVWYKATATWDGANVFVTRSIVESLNVTQTLSLEDDKLRVVVTFSGTTTAGEYVVTGPVTMTYVKR